MTDTFISRVNELSCNELDRFIFAERRGCPIEKIKIIVVDRDASDRNKNNSPHEPHHEFQETADTE